MRSLTYLGVLAFCLVGTAWLEVFLHTRVYARPVRLGLSLIPSLVVFLPWDVYATDRGQWTFDAQQTVGVRVVGLPLEEVLFFVVIPVCAILALEAVRVRRPHWRLGDET